MSQQTDRLNAALAGRYRIDRHLGEGGMASVYLCDDLKHDRKVALKLLKPELAAVLGADRFVVEIKTTASLQHPHILPLFDSGTADGFLFYVMPFIDGETLRDKLNRETQLGVDEAVRIAREVLDALQYAHDHGIVHRDVKPENILLHGGHAMVADFGIALAVSAAAGGRMTETGLSLGTPHYMSPEQATAEKEISARSDVYSLGSVLYEMLTGEPPHMGNSAQQIIMKIITDVPRPVTELRKSVPPNVSDAIARALEKLPADRFASARDFSAALADESHRTATRTRSANAALAGSTAKRAAPWAIAAVAIGAAAFFAWRASAPRSSPELRLAISTRGMELATGAQSVTISPDGRSVVFVGIRGGTRRLYRRALDNADAKALAGTDGADQATFSPDGRSLLFTTTDGAVKRISADGGTVESLRSTAAPVGIALNRAGVPVLGMQRISKSHDWGLTSLSSSRDTTVHTITRNVGSEMDHFPVVLEDGGTTLFTHISSTGRGQLAVVSSAGGEREVLDFDMSRVVAVYDGVLLYLDRGDLMAVRFDSRRHRPSGQPTRVVDLAGSVSDAALAEDGTLALVLKRRGYEAVLVDDHGDGTPIVQDTVLSLLPKFSPDGRRIAAASNFRGASGLWIVDVASKAVSKLSPRAPRWMDWSADGRRILRPDTRATFGAYRVEWQGVDAAESPTLFVQLASDATTASVAPDQRAVAFVVRGAVLVRPMVGDTATVSFAVPLGETRTPRFSPDSRWIAYATDAGGRFEVYVQPYPGPGPRLQVSADGGQEPVWSRDGRRLFYRSGRALMAAELSTGATLGVSSRRELFSGDFYESNPFQQAAYDVMPDGHHFVMARDVFGVGAELQVWTGWLPELRRRLAAAPAK